MYFGYEPFLDILLANIFLHAVDHLFLFIYLFIYLFFIIIFMIPVGSQPTADP